MNLLPVWYQNIRHDVSQNCAITSETGLAVWGSNSAGGETVFFFCSSWAAYSVGSGQWVAGLYHWS